jgi:hypothetical protein
MGFPIWTLIGMGVMGLGTFIFILLAYLAQSPGFLLRAGLSGYRLDLRAKAFTGYALACLLLTLGFFLAGVPLEPVGGEAAVMTTTPESTDGTAVAELDETVTITAAGLTPAPANTTIPTNTTTTEPITPTQIISSGAFGGPPADEETTEPESERATETVTATPVPGPTLTPTPVTSTPTNTSTLVPTPTATPTLTPTPIDAETAVIDTDGSTLWIRRSPGGQTLLIIHDQDVVIVRNGRAHQGGILWREVSSVTGVIGWVQEEFLNYNP